MLLLSRVYPWWYYYLYLPCKLEIFSRRLNASSGDMKKLMNFLWNSSVMWRLFINLLRTYGLKCSIIQSDNHLKSLVLSIPSRWTIFVRSGALPVLGVSFWNALWHFCLQFPITGISLFSFTNCSQYLLWVNTWNFDKNFFVVFLSW